MDENDQLSSEMQRIVYDSNKIQRFVNDLDLHVSCGDKKHAIKSLYSLSAAIDQLGSDINYLIGVFE